MKSDLGRAVRVRGLSDTFNTHIMKSLLATFIRSCIVLAAFLAVSGHAQLMPAHVGGNTTAQVFRLDGPVAITWDFHATEGTTSSTVPPTTIVFGQSNEFTSTASASSSASTWFTPEPAVSVSSEVAAATNGTSGLRASAGNESYLTYGMRIVGGPDAIVPIRIDALGVTRLIGTSTGRATAQFQMSDATLDFSLVRRSHIQPGDPSTETPDVVGGEGSFTISDVYSLRTNTKYGVWIQAVSAATVEGNNTASAFASVNPAFEFALDTDASLYHFEYSGGIADTPFTAVPESGAAFATFGTVLLAGVSMRRAIRRRQQNEPEIVPQI